MKVFTILVAILLTLNVFAQAPEKMSYQAVIRNSSDHLVTNQGVGMQISILQTTATGTAVYVETHNIITNANGLVTIEIGSGNVESGDFATIDWANDVYFIKTETDPTTAGGTAYTITGTSQLLSVSYALHAKTAETITGTVNYTETDPVYTSSQSNNITATDITNLSNLSGTNTGDQDISGIALNTQVIQDTASQIRADFPDVSGFVGTETDPTFTAWDKSTGITISESQISDLQTYLTTELDGDATNELQDISISGHDLSLTNGSTITLPDNVNDADADSGNEIQNLSEVLTESNNAGATNITNLADPVNAQDAATKVYVDQMMQIMENNGLTVVDFTSDNTTTTVGIVNFSDNSAINPTTWSWNFGDGNSSVIQNPTHAYTTAGTYTVSLTASNGTITKTETKTNYITVSIDGPGAGLTDINGNNYTSVIIDGQEWMSENLKVTHYPNGDAIPLVTNNTTWGNLIDNNTDDAYSYYNNNASSEADTYGALYTYAAAIGDNWARDLVENQGVCPDDWHLPTSAEWDALESYLGTNPASKLAGNATLWTDGGLNQSNDFGTSGFSAFPSGICSNNVGAFLYLGNYGYWWSATESGSSAGSRLLHYNSPNIFSDTHLKSFGFTVRCVKD